MSAVQMPNAEVIAPDASPVAAIQNVRTAYLSTSVTMVVGLACSMVSGVMCARLLAPAGRGALAVISYYPSLISSILPLGIPLATSFHMSSGRRSANEAASTGFWLTAILGILGSALAVLAAPYLLPADKQELRFAIQLVCGLSVAMVISPVLYAIGRSKHQFHWVNAMQLLNTALYIVALGVMWITHSASALVIAITLQAIQWLIVALQIWRLGKGSFLFRIRLDYCKELFWHGLRFFGPAGAALVYAMADRAFLIRNAGFVENGLYAVAFSAAYPLSLLAETFAQIGFIEVAGSRNPADLVVHRMCVLKFAVLVAGLGSACLVAPLIRIAFGSAFAGAILPTYILLAVMSMRAHSRALESMLRGADRAWPGVLSNCAAFAVVAVGALAGFITGARSLALNLVVAEAFAFAILVAASSFILHISPMHLLRIPKSFILDLPRQFSVSWSELTTRLAPAK
jgi:O-antigen/teichoic acid export membrane protein